MNGIQLAKSVWRKWNILLNAVVTILNYNKSTIDHAIYIKVFSDEITVSVGGVINTTNDETKFSELTIVCK